MRLQFQVSTHADAKILPEGKSVISARAIAIVI